MSDHVFGLRRIRFPNLLYMHAYISCLYDYTMVYLGHLTTCGLYRQILLEVLYIYWMRHCRKWIFLLGHTWYIYQNITLWGCILQFNLLDVQLQIVVCNWYLWYQRTRYYVASVRWAHRLHKVNFMYMDDPKCPDLFEQINPSDSNKKSMLIEELDNGFILV